MLRKLSFGAMAAIALGMSSVAFGQTTTTTTTTTTTVQYENITPEEHWDSAYWSPMEVNEWKMHYKGDEGVLWSHSLMSLNANEDFTLKSLLRRLPGNDEKLLTHAIVGGMEKNADAYMTAWQRGDYNAMNMPGGSNINPANTSGTANETLVGGTLMTNNAYPYDWQIKGLSDMQAFDAMMNSLDASERGMLSGLWPTLTWSEQQAALKLVKDSPRVHSTFIRYTIWSRPYNYGG